MAPNVWGEKHTLRQMLLYTGMLLPLTLIPATLGELGWVYALSAALLGLWLLSGVVKVARATDFTAPAWSLYKNSLLYLALLFAAVMVDGLVPENGAADAPVLLENPDFQVEAARSGR
jgi:protoheme IX farnesyltransferase